MKMRERIFYVTGGCSGLGLAVVNDLLARDGLVCILDKDDQQGNALEKEYTSCLVFHKCDICSEAQVVSGLRNALEMWPGRLIGGLIHCAGVASIDQTVSSHGQPGSLDLFKNVIDVNLTGSFNVARLVAAEIVKQNHPTSGSTTPLKPGEDHGVIVFTSSTSYQDGQMGQVAYAASKGGIASLVLPMARDLARFGIRVNAIAPSLFNTQMAELLPPKVKNNLLDTVEFPVRFGNPQEFSSLVIECIRNTYLNGTVIRIDAGGRMGKI